MTESANRHSDNHASRPRRIMLPPFWMLLALCLQWLAHRYLPLWQIPLPGLGIAGTLIAAMGLILIAVSLLGFSRAGTGIVPFHEATALVSHGFYRFTRNPMYLGMVCILLGVALKAGSLATLLPIPLFMWVIRQRYILPEEQFLEDAFGDAYRAYKARVRRWL